MKEQKFKSCELITLILVIIFSIMDPSEAGRRRGSLMVRKMLRNQNPRKLNDEGFYRGKHSTDKSFDWTDILSGAGRFSHNRTSADQKEIDYLISDERDLPGFKSKQNFEKKSAGIGAENNLLCPDGKDYCEDPSGYPPDDLIKSFNMTSLEKFVLLLNPANDGFTQRKTNKTPVYPNSTVTISMRKSGMKGRIVNQRVKTDRRTREKETAVCETLPRVIYPRYGRNRDDEYRYIYNPDKGPETRLRQSIKVEECVSDGNQCNLCHGIRTVCRQKFSYHK